MYGRYYTPGNYNINNKEGTSEPDNNGYINTYQAKMSIIPPTGTKQIIIYCSIGIVCLVVLAGGIILIKKKVIN